MKNKDREPFFPSEMPDYWVLVDPGEYGYGPSAFSSFEELVYRINVPVKQLGIETIDLICDSAETLRSLCIAKLMDDRGINPWDERVEKLFLNGPLRIRFFEKQLIARTKYLIERNIEIATGRGSSFAPEDITAAIERRREDWDPEIPWDSLALQVAAEYYSQYRSRPDTEYDRRYDERSVH